MRSRSSTGCDSSTTVAYLVGGSVRDLLLGRRPKDFDIGTSAHPYQIKKLFRNCWIIGRRFRLAHVQLRAERRSRSRRSAARSSSGDEIVQDGVPAPDPIDARGRAHSFTTTTRSARPKRMRSGATSRSTRSFYDIANVFDHRLRRRPRRSARRRRALDWRSACPAAGRSGADDSGDRAGRTARLHDRPRAPRRHPHPSPRDLEELAAAIAGGALQDSAGRRVGEGVPRPRRGRPARSRFPRSCIAAPTESLWRSLAELDAYRRKFPVSPKHSPIRFCSAVCSCRFGVSLLLAARRRLGEYTSEADDRGNLTRPRLQVERRRTPAPKLGTLPIARRDMERLQQLGLQRRLAEAATARAGIAASCIAASSAKRRTWLEVHGGDPAMVEFWTAQACRRRQRRTRRAEVV